MLTTAGLARKDNGSIFIAKRKPSKYLGACWEFPGGKVKTGENSQQALEREFLEEFGVLIRVGDEFCSGEFWGNGNRYTVKVFWIELAGEPECREHTETRWVPLPKVFTYPFPPSDTIVLGALRAYEKESFIK